MPIVAVVHPNAQFRQTLKRGIGEPHLRVITCRTVGRVETLIRSELVDAVVADVKRPAPQWFFDIMRSFPNIPSFAVSAFRPDDGRLLSACLQAGVDTVLVEGVDEAVAGEIVANRCSGARVRISVADAPRLLRLRDELQLRVWDEVMNLVGSQIRTSDIAASVGVSREHLSREFAAGGAPNLKRVIDLARVIRAADLLGNPGYSVNEVARILQFASASHLSSSARRVAEATPRKLAELGPRGILATFLGGKTRSRL